MAAAVGGILATVAKQAAHRDAELDELPLLDRLERRYSIPRWWAGRWVRTLSPDRAIARAQAIARPPPVEVCVAPHADLETIATTLAERRTHARVVRIEGVPRGLALSAAGDVFYAPEATAGDLWVQSGPSQRVGHVLDPQPGESVLDLCAGRGTKTQQIAALLGGRGRIVAADVDPRRLDDLRDRLAAGRIRRPDGGLEVIVHDATEPVPEPWREAFDAVLVDAPCTGLGEAARHPEVRYRRRFEDLAACQARQRSILTEAAATVRPGGRLVYAVCSTEAEEGPDVLAAFIRDRGDFEVTHTETLQPEDGWSAGFFVARLERRIDAA
ncbi:MAG: RsmB/NOP family class I SAM-dependent RNA methyltransferase [Deltaproteobacteria bacterium]|nr:MAG: RsmB/NOP family class I SAM-dependent RNA methyltransferase [Deltaproteobacteria bacterium]